MEYVNQNNRQRLAIFDLDGTLTEVRSPFIYVSEALGYGAEVSDIASRYWRGEISYESWGKQIVALWKGIREKVLCDIVGGISYRNGAEAFIRYLQGSGVTVGLLSVAFQQHVLPRAAELKIDLVQCNELHVRDGLLTGGYSYTVNERNKKDAIRAMQLKYGFTADQTFVAGDSEGDIPMFSVAKVSIAVAPESNNVLKAASLKLPSDDWHNAVKLIESEFPDWLPSIAK